MATKKYDLVIKTGSYSDRDGNKKNRYKNVGAVFTNDDGGAFILMDKTFNPAGVTDEKNSDQILISCMAPRDMQSDGRDKPQQNKRSSMNDDDLPF